MALVVQLDDGSITNANSYIESTYADTYFSDRGKTAWASLTNKDALLIQATDFLERVYFEKWKGYRLTETQNTEWPRLIDDVDLGLPERLKQACCDLALQANSGELLPNVEKNIIKQKVAVIETTYSEYSDQLTRYTNVYELLSTYLENASLNSSKVVRT